MTIQSTRTLHLVVLPLIKGELRLASEGPYGCDYAWNQDYTAYRCMPHRWLPGSDSSYIDHMLDGLGVTDAQRTQIKQIAIAAANDLKAQREAGRALHEQGMQLFAAPTVDAAAAESLRQQMQAQHDQASKRMLQAMLDASEVLTPEQRAKMVERMKQRGAMMKDRREREHRERGPRPQQ